MSARHGRRPQDRDEEIAKSRPRLAPPSWSSPLPGAWGFSTLNGASDASTRPRSPPSSGHDDPLGRGDRQGRADHQGRDQIEGERHHRAAVRRRRSGGAAGQVLAELDKENLTARLREARANLQAAEAAHEAAVAQLKKNEIEAESPDVAFARRNHARARAAVRRRSWSRSRRWTKPKARSSRRRTASAPPAASW